MTTPTPAPQPISVEIRRAILQRDIGVYVRSGFLVVSQTDYSAQLRRPKVFSCLFAALWFLLFGLGIIVYLIYYGAKRDELVYIEINDYGQRKIEKEGSVSNLVWVSMGALAVGIGCVGCLVLGTIFGSIDPSVILTAVPTP